MRKHNIRTWILAACLITLTGCGNVPETSAPSAGDSSLSDDALSADNTPASGDSLTSGDASSSDDVLSADDASSPAESAHAAYSALLSGDISLFDDDQITTWGLEDWADYLNSGSLTYEYTYLDLDGDGVDELLFQMENDPRGHNAVFHYADGRLFCWENDMVEATSGHYPLSDGTMVSEYYHSGSYSYTIFRYLSNGEQDELCSLFAREELLSEELNLPCPYYEIDGVEVDQSAFEARLEELITTMLLPRSAWTTL